MMTRINMNAERGPTTAAELEELDLT